MKVLGKAFFVFFVGMLLTVFPKTKISFAEEKCLINDNWYNSKNRKSYTKGYMIENPKYIVIHHSAFKDLESLKKVFEDNNVSCHYFIDGNGVLSNVIDDSCIAYHAGFSYWNGEENLNNSSICIELLNESPFIQDINDKQYNALTILLKQLKNKYNISNTNIVSHSDISYFNKDFMDGNFLNRKQDVSYLFRWKKLAQKNVGIWYHEEDIDKNDRTVLYYFGDEKDELIDVKDKLREIGYKINDMSNKYSVEFYMQSIVFHRRFLPEQLIMAGQGLWTKSSTDVLNAVVKEFYNLNSVLKQQ